MLDAMSQIALDHLRNQLSGDAQGEHDPWEWYLRLREEHPQSLFPYLIEPARASMSPNYYAMRADPNDPDVAILEQRELREGDELRLPFVPSTGSQSGALGPVIKRTYNRQTGAVLRAKLTRRASKTSRRSPPPESPGPTISRTRPRSSPVPNCASATSCTTTARTP